MKKMTRIAAIMVMALTIITGATLDGFCATRAKKAVSGVLNINTATAQEWTLFPGIGKAKADAILETRAAGNFASVEDLVKVKGIGPKFLEKFRGNLSVDGQTTIQKSVAESPQTASAQPLASGGGMLGQ